MLVLPCFTLGLAMQCVQAAQLTFEDYFMADLSVAPLKIVGVEGLFGSLLMLLVLLPLVSVLPGKDGFGLHEDTWDTIHVSVIAHACLHHGCMCV